MSNIMNDLHAVGINPFAVTMLAESALRSPFVDRMATEPFDFFFPISRGDCAGWAGVRISFQPVATGVAHQEVESGEPQGAPKTRTQKQMLDWMTPGQMAEEIMRLDAIVSGQARQLVMGRFPLLAPEYPLDAALDPIYGAAVEVVKRTGKPSISLVQLHLSIGYNRAARLLERMEVERMVSPMGENGIRTVLEGGAA